MAKELALVLSVALGIPLAIFGFLWLLFATLGGMATLGAIITLDLMGLIGFIVIATHNRKN